MGIKWTNLRCLCITEMADVDFLETTDDSNPQIDTSVIPEGIYILTRNDVISYFRSTGNRVHATTIVADFTVIKWTLGNHRQFNLDSSHFEPSSPRQPRWDECHCVSQCPANRWAFLFLNKFCLPRRWKLRNLWIEFFLNEVIRKIFQNVMQWCRLRHKYYFLIYWLYLSWRTEEWVNMGGDYAKDWILPF